MTARIFVFLFWFVVFMLLYLGVVFWISDVEACASSAVISLTEPLTTTPITCI